MGFSGMSIDIGKYVTIYVICHCGIGEESLTGIRGWRYSLTIIVKRAGSDNFGPNNIKGLQLAWSLLHKRVKLTGRENK